jgi:hypothetical protein
MLHKDYDSKRSVENNSGPDPQGVWRQGELIGGKPPVVQELFDFKMLDPAWWRARITPL